MYQMAAFCNALKIVYNVLILILAYNVAVDISIMVYAKAAFHILQDARNA